MSPSSSRLRRSIPALAGFALVAGILVAGGAFVLGGCAKGELEIPFTDEELEARSRDEARVDAGRQAFGRSCTACHGRGGVGLTQGPSLVDEEWLKGNGPREIYHSIAVGAPEKGMASWAWLGKEKVADLTAYVLYLSR